MLATEVLSAGLLVAGTGVVVLTVAGVGDVIRVEASELHAPSRLDARINNGAAAKRLLG